MVIHQAKTLEEAVKLRHEIENSAYLAGGTEVLRLNSSVDSNAELIDISVLLDASISIDGDKLIIGAGAIVGNSSILNLFLYGSSVYACLSSNFITLFVCCGVSIAWAIIYNVLGTVILSKCDVY